MIKDEKFVIARCQEGPIRVWSIEKMIHAGVIVGRIDQVNSVFISSR